MIDPNDELSILGEDPSGYLVKTPGGEEVMLGRGRVNNYARVGDKFIPKSKIEWN